jgi:hypothetical protein
VRSFPLDVDGACYGFTVRSDLDLVYLRNGGGGPELRVGSTTEPDPGPEGEPIQEWLPREHHPFHARLFGEDDRFRFWVEGLGSYHVDPAAPAVDVPSGTSIGVEERLWGIPAVLCFMAMGDHSLHASAVQIGDRAIAFGAPGRFGKTTMASALVAAGHRLLSEDSTCVRIGPDGVAVVPGPAMLRVRRDAYERLRLPGVERVSEDDDRVHLRLEGDARDTGDPVPLAGVMLLRPGPDADPVRIELVEPEAAIPDLWALSFKFPTDEGRATCFDDLGQLTASVPVWDLTRPMRFEALDGVVRAVSEVAS